MFEWSPGTRDGESALQRELFWRRESWIEWSEKHPELAAVLWPRVLSLLRGDDRIKGQFEAVTLLREIQWADDEAHAKQVLEGLR
jgi:hypothetical protein